MARGTACNGRAWRAVMRVARREGGIDEAVRRVVSLFRTRQKYVSLGQMHSLYKATCAWKYSETCL